ncbi:MAG: hypothetical protein ABIJ59_01820 [Pseudomonadota bacterium]
MFSLLCIFIIFYGLEKILGFKNKDIVRYSNGISRDVRLREHNPYSFQEFFPDQLFLDMHPANSFLKKFIIRIDKNGFIMPSERHDDPDLKIVFLGASTTECLFNEETKRFPYLVGEYLEKETGLKINAYNGGKGGNNTLHSINILLNKIFPMKPDIVVMKHAFNDLVILLLEKTYWNNNPKRSPVRIVKEQYHLLDALKHSLATLLPNIGMEMEKILRKKMKLRGMGDEFRHARGRKIDVDKEYLLNEFKKNLATFVELCRIRNITPVLMTQANRLRKDPDAFVSQSMVGFENDYGVDYSRFQELYNLFNLAIREIGENKNVLVVDLDKEVPKENLYMFDIIHYTELGSQKAAAIISRQLLTLADKQGKN